MTTIRRIAGLLWVGALAGPELTDELKQDRGVADDGLIAVSVIGTVIVGVTTLSILTTALAPILSPLVALFAAFVLRLVNRIAGHQVDLAETTATVTLTSLPLLLVAIPVVGGPIGITWWLLAGIFTLRRVTLARIDAVAVVTLLSHGLTIGVLFGVGFAIDALR